MKAAHLKDDDLLADIAQARRAGTTSLWWLGQSGFLVVTPEGTLLFDPYLSDSLTRKYAGESVKIAGVTLHGITAAHNTVDRDGDSNCRFMGFVAQVAGRTFYHSGDTLPRDGLADSLKPFAPDVSFVPINGNRPERRVTGNLDGAEAAFRAKETGTRLASTHHFDMFAFNTASPELFEFECSRLHQPFHVLGNGEGLRL